MEQMKIEQNGHELVVHLSGKLDIDFVQANRDTCLSAADGATRVLLDFSGTDYMDSSGLGFLVSIRKKMEAKGGTLILKQVPQVVRQLLTLTRLTNTFEIQ